MFLHSRGIGSISPSKTSSLRETASFRFAIGDDEIFTREASYWLECIAAWANEPESDFAFALAWRGKRDEERAQCLTQLSRGDWDELRRVAQWILALEGHERYIPDAKTPRTLIVRLGCFDGQFSLWVSDEDDEFSTRRQRLWDEWLRFFGLALDSETIERHTAASYSANQGFDWDYFRRSALLSQHEYLEIRLQLRDWLRDSVGLPKQGIAELLA